MGANQEVANMTGQPEEGATLLSPPLSPFDDNELPIIPIDDRGMIIGNGGPAKENQNAQTVKKKPARRPKPPADQICLETFQHR